MFSFGGDAEEGAEGGVPGSPLVEAEVQLVAVGLELHGAKAKIDAECPGF